ncbi:delta-1-pyrroline-5-carboxylate synthase-like [Tubulanus polymorphus]|uniref:delta-1-pyrroline-5-carboxylate synthase-like n=1 Tax=Tubulanus polymorphus TaxID=672921 RepID=UPI003DA23356
MAGINRRVHTIMKNIHLVRQIHRQPLAAPTQRALLSNSECIVVKLGSAVITRTDECGLALGRLASIVEQISELHNLGKQMVMITSGAVAFGKQKLRQEIMMSMSMRQTINSRESMMRGSGMVDPRACAASGMSGLMALYEQLFGQYGIQVAQILVTKPDLENENNRSNLQGTIRELLRLNIVPIVNANDAVAPPPCADIDLQGVISVKDNDSLAARLAVEIKAELLIIMSDVDGLYTTPPGESGSRLLHSFSPLAENINIVFGTKSRVGMGGMESKVKAASWALGKGTSVVICNGTTTHRAILDIVYGKKVGTFFTPAVDTFDSIENQALEVRNGGRILSALKPEDRAAIVIDIARNLIEQQGDILDANKQDLQEARNKGKNIEILSRLALSPEKILNLSEGLHQIAERSLTNIGRVINRTEIAEGMILEQVSVPIGVLLVIFESRPDCLPQVAALAIASGNGLLLKGGKEAYYSNQILHEIVCNAVDRFVPLKAVCLVRNREDIHDLLQLSNYIDLVIPRGSKELVSKIQGATDIPVLGHSEGVCHVYIDNDVDRLTAKRIVRDSKCNYPSACNSMESLLFHGDHLNNNLFDEVIDMLTCEGVTIYSGPNLQSKLKFGPTAARNMSYEYGSLACTVEIVDDLEDAINHVNRYGSAHTDVIVTSSDKNAQHFMKLVDSACVFVNCSSRFADGYRFGLGAEVGISTSRIHARGPVGVDGLLTTKWQLVGTGQTVADFNDGKISYLHHRLPNVDDSS